MLLSVVVTRMPPNLISKRDLSCSRTVEFFRPNVLVWEFPFVATNPSSAVSLHLGPGGVGGAAGAGAGAGAVVSWARASGAAAQATARQVARTGAMRIVKPPRVGE